jgi:predicted MPP superfamily phosphohydrolase
MKAETAQPQQGPMHGRLVGFLVFLFISFTLYTLVHFSVLLTLRAWFPSAKITITIVVLWLASILSLFVARYAHNPVTNLLYRLGVTWMGIAFLLFLVLFPATMAAIALRGTLSPLLMVPAIGLILISTWLAHNTRIKHVDIAVGKLPKAMDGFRIVHLTDLHIGEIYGPAFLQHVVDNANSLKADLIVITGDVFDGGGKTYEGIVDPLKQLRAKHGVYYVRGNHDVYEGIANTNKLITECGIIILDDDVARVAGLSLCGLSYPADLVDHKRDILAELAQRAGVKRPRILLRHEPRDPVLAAELGYDLMLSGHTHNGQIWPLSYLVRLAYPFRVGQHRIKQMSLYIGPGIGTWGPPLRLGSRSEITQITLRHLD